MSKTKSKSKNNGYYTPPGWRHEKWTREQALKLINAYEQTDEPARVLYSSPSENVDIDVVGQVSFASKDETLRGDHDAVCVSVGNGPDQSITFSLTSDVQFEYFGGSHHIFTKPNEIGDPTQLWIQNPKTGDEIVIWDLPGGAVFIPVVGNRICDGKEITKAMLKRWRKEAEEAA